MAKLIRILICFTTTSFLLFGLYHVYQISKESALQVYNNNHSFPGTRFDSSVKEISEALDLINASCSRWTGDNVSTDFSINRERYQSAQTQIQELELVYNDSLDFYGLRTKEQKVEKLDYGFDVSERLDFLIEEQKNLIKAMAKNGDPLAIRKFAHTLINAKEYSRAISILNIAANLGDPHCMKMLSHLYSYQMPRIFQNKAEGAKWDYLAECFWNSDLGKSSLMSDESEFSPTYYKNSGYSEEDKKKGLELAKDWLRHKKV